MANSQVRARLDSAISKLISFQPLYGEVFLHLNKRESKDIPTMAVGVIRRVDLALYYNPDFVATWRDHWRGTDPTWEYRPA